MEEVKILIVGQSPYNNTKNYGPLKVDGYISEVVAFFPKINEEKYNLYNLTTYRRLLGFLKAKPLTEEEVTALDSPKKLVDCYKSKGVYFVNEIDIENIDSDTITFQSTKYSIDIKNTKIICFGSKAIDRFENVKRVIKYPHPSPKVTHKFWEQFDYEYTNYDKPIDFTKLLNTL